MQKHCSTTRHAANFSQFENEFIGFVGASGSALGGFLLWLGKWQPGESSVRSGLGNLTYFSAPWPLLRKIVEPQESDGGVVKISRA